MDAEFVADMLADQETAKAQRTPERWESIAKEYLEQEALTVADDIEREGCSQEELARHLLSFSKLYHQAMLNPQQAVEAADQGKLWEIV